jgi:hypothetical protein
MRIPLFTRSAVREKFVLKEGKNEPAECDANDDDDRVDTQHQY